MGDAQVADPRTVTDRLHQLWLERRPVVVELGAAQDALRVAQCYDGPVHDLSPAFEFTMERLHFLVWANNYDARGRRTRLVARPQGGPPVRRGGGHRGWGRPT